MANSGNDIPIWRKGDRLRAEDLNKIAPALIRRMTGGAGVRVGATGRDLIVSVDAVTRRTPPDTVIATLGAETGVEAGEYAWTLYAGSGPEAGAALELNGVEGLPYGINALLRRAGGVWFFSALGLEARYLVTGIGDDTLTVQLLEPSTVGGAGGTVTGDAAITIWKPIDLQRQTYAGLTFDGNTYTHVDSQTRTSAGVDTETQIIIPPYVADNSVIVAGFVANGGGIGAGIGRLADKNRGGRAWTKEAE